MRKTVFLLLIIGFSIIGASNIFCQKQGQALIDSLLQAISNYKSEDTTKVLLLHSISFEYNSINPEQGIEYGLQGLKLAEKIHFRKGIADCLRSLGVCYWAKSDYPKSLEYFIKSIKIAEDIGYKRGIASCNGNIGLIYASQKDYDKANYYFFMALEIYKELRYKNGIASTYGHIGNVYNNQANYSKALEYYFKALKIQEELGRKTGIATSLGNIGKAYQLMFNYQKAMEYIFMSLKINRELKRNRGIMFNLGDIGEIYYLIATDTVNKVSSIQEKKDYFNKSISYSLQAAAIGKEIGAGNELINWYANLSRTYGALGNWQKAYYYNDLSHQMHDSVFSTVSRNKIVGMEFQQEKELKEREIRIQKLEIERNRILIYSAVTALVFMMLLAFFIYTRFIIKKKSNILLEKKNRQILEQNEKIDRAYNNIKMLSDIGQDITTNLTAEKIIDMVYDNVRTLMNSSVFAIGIYNQEQNRLDFPGAKELGETLPYYYCDLEDENRLAVYCYKNQEDIIIADYFRDSKQFIKEITPPAAGRITESLLYTVLNTKEKKIGVITVQSFEKNAYTEYHLDILKNLSIYVAIALDNSEAYRFIEKQKIDIEEKNQVLEVQREEIISKNSELVELYETQDKYLSTLKLDLKLAADYVKSLIPPPIDTGHIKTKWIFIPTEEVGGDSLGYHWIDKNNFAIYLIDVSGHGIGPALHTVSILNSLRNESLPNVNFKNPDEVLSKLNETYQMEKYNEKFFTIWYGVYNTETEMLNYAGAGHPPCFMIASDNRDSRLDSENLIIGCFTDFKYRSKSIKIKKPARIYIYSDGVYEIKKKDGCFWEIDEMLNYLKETSTLQNGNDIEKLYNYTKEISGKEILDDDFSILKLVLE